MQNAYQLNALGALAVAVDHDIRGTADDKLSRAGNTPRAAYFWVFEQGVDLAGDLVALFNRGTRAAFGDVVDLGVKVA